MNARVLCLVGGEFFMLPVEMVVDPRVGVCPDIWCQVDGLRLGRFFIWSDRASGLVLAKTAIAHEAIGLSVGA